MNPAEAYISIADYAPAVSRPERAGSFQAHSFTPLLATLAGDHWRKGSEGIFTQVWTNGDNALGEAGFKIRLAAHSAVADEVLRVAVPIIVEAKCPFKVIANTALLELAGAKWPSEDPAGDFLTVYPPSQTVFEELRDDLREAVQGIKAPHVAPSSTATAGRPALSQENPWPGRDSYMPGESSFFFGREEEQQELGQRIERAQITVMLGQAGVGKSSLLQAGLKPFFEQHSFEAVYIRLDVGGEAQPVQQVRDEINRCLAEGRIDGPPFGEGQTLRDYFQTPRTGWVGADRKPVVPVLIFDQFEEVLALDDAVGRRPVEAFWTQMANLVGARGGRESGGQLALPSFDAGGGARFKVVISLRQEQLPRLLARRGPIPAVAQNHFVLKPINGLKAVQIVLGPGRAFFEPARAEALGEKIVRSIAGQSTQPSEKPGHVDTSGEPLENLRADSALLSYYCKKINEARRTAKPGGTVSGLITEELILSESPRLFEAFLHPESEERGTLIVAEPGVAVEPGPPQVVAAISLPSEAAIAPESQAIVEADEPSKAVHDEPPPASQPTQIEEPESETAPAPAKSEPQLTVVPAESPGPEAVADAPSIIQLPQPEPVAPAEVPLVVLPSPEPEAKPTESKPVVETTEEQPAMTTAAPQIAIQPSSQKGVADNQTERKIESAEFTPIPASSGKRSAGRLKGVVVVLGMVSVVIFAALVVMYVEERQRAQTEVELEEYISSIAAAKNTFRSVHQKLSLAETDLALKESNVLALIEQSRQQEQENEAEKERNSKLSGEKESYQTRINQLNSEKAQAEARFAQWSSLLQELTNQITTLSAQKESLEARNHALISNNRALSATNAALSAQKVEPVYMPATTNVPEESLAAAMKHFPEQVPGAIIPDTDSSGRRNADVLLTHGECLYSDGGVGFRPLELRQVLHQGAILQTGKNSWCDIFIRRTGTMVRLAPESQMRIARLALGTESGFPIVETLLVLPHGRMFTIVRAMVPGSTLEVSDGVGRSVIEVGGLGSYMISAPAPDFGDKLTLTPLHLITQQGTSLIAPGQEYSAKDGVVFSLTPTDWELTLLHLDEAEAEADKALPKPANPKP